MRKPYLYNGLAVFVLLLVVAGAFRLGREVKSKDGEQDFDTETLSIKEALLAYFLNDGTELNDPTVYRGAGGLNPFPFSSLADEGTLVFRFSGEGCGICVESVVDQIRSVFPDFEHNDRIALLGSQVVERQKIRYYGKPIISFVDEELNLPIEPLRMPYFFVTNKAMHATLFFIPDPDHPYLTDLYLKTVSDRFGF